MKDSKKMLVVLLIIIAIVLFVGCERAGTEMTVVYYESEITSPTAGYGIAYFEPWNLYEGRLTGQEADNLIRIAEETAECVSAFGSNYVLLSVPEYNFFSA